MGVNPGDDLLSHGLSHTTIGAAAFHFRVRDGIGWFHSANFTRETVGAARCASSAFLSPVSHDRRSCATGADSRKAGACKKRKTPLHLQRGFRGVNPGDDLLSHGLSHTTIGAAAFHFRVRDGIGWFHSANFTRETVGASLIPIKIGVAPVSHKVLGSSLLFRFQSTCVETKAT